MRRKRIILLILCSLICLACTEAQETAHQVRLSISKYGFSIGVPEDWNGGLGPSGLPVFFNYQPSAEIGAGALPQGGAILSMMTNERGHRKWASVKTPSDWARYDKQRANAKTIAMRRLELPVSTTISQALVLSFDWSALESDERQQHEFNIYWVFDGKLFAAHLLCASGDPKTQEYERLVIETVQSIRPVGDPTPEKGHP